MHPRAASAWAKAAPRPSEAPATMAHGPYLETNDADIGSFLRAPEVADHGACRALLTVAHISVQWSDGDDRSSSIHFDNCHWRQRV